MKQEQTCEQCKRLKTRIEAVASDIRFAIRDDAHVKPEFVAGHRRILEICAERLEDLVYAAGGKP